MMNKLTPYLNFMKENRNEIFWLKFVIIIVINIWLLLIFWKIIVLNGLNFTNNNIALSKMNTWFQPMLQLLGIDFLSPNTIKMMIISSIILGVNLSVLYFNQMILLGISIGIARYSYKSYSNYLINQENMKYMGFETVKTAEIIQKPIVKATENAPIIIETVSNASTTNWGLWLALGGVAVVTIFLIIYSHNNLSNSIIETNEVSRNTTIAIRNQLNNIDSKTNHINSQVDLIFTNHDKMFDNLKNTDTLINEKIINLENTVQEIGENLTKVGHISNENILNLSKQSLTLSQQANEALTEIAEASSTVEATTLGLAKIWEIVKEYIERVENLENKAGIQVQTPRNININPLNIKKNAGEE